MTRSCRRDKTLLVLELASCRKPLSHRDKSSGVKLIRHCSRSVYSENIAPLILCLGIRRMNQLFSADGARAIPRKHTTLPSGRLLTGADNDLLSSSVMEIHPITVSSIYICWFWPSRERRGIIPPSVYFRRFRVEKKVTKHWLSRMHFSISSASPTRWALKWIIKCKLPSVICHVVWGAQGVFSWWADATQHFPGKIFHVGHIFLRHCYRQMAKLERSPFQNHLCAHFDSLSV